MLISAPASLGILVSQQLVSVVASDQAPQRGKGKKRGQRGKISGSVASRADNLLARFARRCFFFTHTNFFSFSQCGARSQAMSVDISSPVFTLTKWEEGRSRQAVFPETYKRVGAGEKEKKRAGVLRSSREARGAPFPSSHRLPRACYYFYWDTQPAEASAEKRAVILSSASNFSRSVANKDP